eukprot:3325202-Rhodomonas_salina.1
MLGVHGVQGGCTQCSVLNNAGRTRCAALSDAGRTRCAGLSWVRYQVRLMAGTSSLLTQEWRPSFPPAVNPNTG